MFFCQNKPCLYCAQPSKNGVKQMPHIQEPAFKCMVNAIFITLIILNNISVTILLFAKINRLAYLNDKNLNEISDIEVMHTGL